MDGVLSSPAFTSSGWILTLAGAVFALLTFWQVGRKDSAFRRALIAATRRDMASGLQASADELAALSRKLPGARSQASRRQAAMEWPAVAGRLLALLEAEGTSDPLNVASRDYSRWETQSGKRLAQRLRAQSNQALVAETETSAARKLALALEASSDAAREVLMAADDGNFTHFCAQASTVVELLAYVAGRTHHARSREIHDDR